MNTNTEILPGSGDWFQDTSADLVFGNTMRISTSAWLLEDCSKLCPFPYNTDVWRGNSIQLGSFPPCALPDHEHHNALQVTGIDSDSIWQLRADFGSHSVWCHWLDFSARAVFAQNDERHKASLARYFRCKSQNINGVVIDCIISLARSAIPVLSMNPSFVMEVMKEQCRPGESASTSPFPSSYKL